MVWRVPRPAAHLVVRLPSDSSGRVRQAFCVLGSGRHAGVATWPAPALGCSRVMSGAVLVRRSVGVDPWWRGVAWQVSSVRRAVSCDARCEGEQVCPSGVLGREPSYRSLAQDYATARQGMARWLLRRIHAAGLSSKAALRSC